jgi:glycosyltransferase involved in cell wall biosynthesis
VLLPEVFYDPARVKYYATSFPQSGAHFFPIVFDFMPLLNPEVYRVAPGTANTLMPYIGLVRQARSRAFISGRVREDFVGRILRREPGSAVGEVIPLGADGLALPKQTFDASRRNLVCIGTLEGKKHQEMVFDAFRSLGPDGEGKLQFLGAVPKNLAPWLRRVVAYSGPDVEVVDSPSDGTIVACLRRARATVFVSTNEGFGLPAVESLFCGIPVVAHAGLPALRDIPDGGQLRLTDVTTDSVAGALRRLRDEGEAERLWQGASDLRLQTWSGYARAVVDWVRSA